MLYMIVNRLCKNVQEDLPVDVLGQRVVFVFGIVLARAPLDQLVMLLVRTGQGLGPIL